MVKTCWCVSHFSEHLLSHAHPEVFVIYVNHYGLSKCFNNHATYTSGPFTLILYHFTADNPLCLVRNLRRWASKGTRGNWSTRSSTRNKSWSNQKPSEGLATGERKLQCSEAENWATEHDVRQSWYNFLFVQFILNMRGNSDSHKYFVSFPSGDQVYPSS